MTDVGKTLPFHELQQKILPELHLIAAGYGIENYRKLKKDALALALAQRPQRDRSFLRLAAADDEQIRHFLQAVIADLEGDLAGAMPPSAPAR